MEGPFLMSSFQILCLVILICFIASTSAYFSLSVVEMILAAVFFVIYMCDLNTRIKIINWPWSVRKGPEMARQGGGAQQLGLSWELWTLTFPFSLPLTGFLPSPCSSHSVPDHLHCCPR